jgi:TolA-binding protein
VTRAGLAFVLAIAPPSLSRPFDWNSEPRLAMAETPRLSVEKALEKLRANDSPKSKKAQLDDKTDALNEEIKRMKAQRLRLDRSQRTKRD